MVKIPECLLGNVPVELNPCDRKNGERCRACAGGIPHTEKAIIRKILTGDLSYLCGPQHEPARRTRTELEQLIADNHLERFCWQMVMMIRQANL
jgi:hypothetical protein